MKINIQTLLGRKPKSSSVAKQRLKVVIRQDRFAIDKTLMTRLHGDIADVLSRYFDFTVESVQMSLKQEGNSYVLVADIPYNKLHDFQAGR